MDEDYGFDDGYGDFSDYGVTDFDDATQAGFDVSGVTSSDFSTGDSAEDYSSAIMGQTPLQAVETFSGPRGVADYILNQTGNRSNIRNAVNYDPLFAQALNIDRGLLPGNQVIGFYPTASQFQGQQDLTIPMDMRPTISGRAGEFGPQYYSGVEKFLQEDAPGLVKSAMNMGIGGLLNKFTSAVSSTANSAKEALDGGIEYLKNSFDGLSLQEIKETVTDTNAMNMPEAAIIREKYDYGDRPLSDVMGQNTFGSMPMNTGIANVSPNISNQANQANMAVTDALQLIPEGTLADSIGVRNQVAQALDPELKAFVDSQPSIDQKMREIDNKRKERERDEQFRKEVLSAIQNSSRSQPRYVAQNPFKPFDNSGNFIPVD